MTENQTFELRGVKLYLPAELLTPNIKISLEKGNYERAEAQNLTRIIEKGDRIVELGGGIGYLSSAIAKLGLASVIAVYEANPNLIPVIKNNHAANGAKAEVHNSVVVPLASSPSIPFYVRKDFWASSMDEGPWPYKSVVKVPTVSFGKVLRRHRPTMLIVDIEGGEAHLFKGIDLSTIEKISIEVHPPAIGDAAVKSVIDFIQTSGFTEDKTLTKNRVLHFQADQSPNKKRMRRFRRALLALQPL